MTPQIPSTPKEDNIAIISLITSGSKTGEELLYTTYYRGLRFLAGRHSPRHADDCVQDTFVAAIKQIRSGGLTTPEALPAYLGTILRRIAWNLNTQGSRRSGGQDEYEIAVMTHADDRPDPARELEVKQQAQVMMDCLRSLKPKRQEILTRFYLNNEPPEDICRAMGLTETQFRLNKCRSKKMLEAAVAKATSQAGRQSLGSAKSVATPPSGRSSSTADSRFNVPN